MFRSRKNRSRRLCPISFSWVSASFFSSWSPLTRAFALVFDRGRAMLEPLVGLIVAALLGVYLLYTLLHPEDF
jgi:K+-transporting ATPase KdpF subunit